MRLVNLGLILSAALTAQASTPVIIDTDASPDYDDIGALAVLHALADAGEAEILATVACNRTPACVPAIEIVNAAYGRADLPVGVVREGGVSIADGHRIPWPVRLMEKYAADVRHAASGDAPSAVRVYRETLAKAADGSVTICSVGFFTNLADLLASPPDDISPLNGCELVRRKVKSLVAMCGYAGGGREFNVYSDAASARKVFAEWPGPIVISPAEVGKAIRTGTRVAALPDDRHPVRDVYATCLAQGDREGRQSWDQTVVLAAVRGDGGLFARTRGRFAVINEQGVNSWVDDENGPHELLRLAAPSVRAAATIEELMCRMPAVRQHAYYATSRLAGPVKVDSSGWRSWRPTISVKQLDRDVEEIEISLASQTSEIPPRFSVSFDVPQVDMHHRWFMDYERVTMPPDWNAVVETRLCRSLPVVGFLNDNDANRMTVSCSEAKRTVRTKAGLREEDCHVVWNYDFFSEVEAPLTRYTVRLRIDRRPVFFGEAIADGARWIGEAEGLKPLAVPSAAGEPLYSSWYSFHQNVFAETIEAECRQAAQLGMKTLIVDDGWQTDDTNRGYQFTGDWTVSPRRFPDFASHVQRVQAMGLKYLIWYSVPFVGPKSANYARFKGKYLSETRDHATLDPRFPEVRAFLCETYERAMRTWGLDGLKLDFIDEFRFDGKDPALAEDYAGRDVKSLPEAVDRLMSEITARIKAVRPDALIEFRQSYVGPCIRQYGNLLRAGDCPGDLLANRVRMANLRLIAGETAVHSDMLEWSPEDTPENAARFILSSIFGAVQYSMMLRSLPEDHRRMMAHWISFSRHHRETLQHGRFRPHHFESFYPLIEAESRDERIVAVYSDAAVVKNLKPDRETYLLNATGEPRLFVELTEDPASVEVYDTFGAVVETISAEKGLRSLAVPCSGYAKIVPRGENELVARAREIATWLAPRARTPGRLPSDRAAWAELAGLTEAGQILATAETEAHLPIPELTDELYRDFSRTGNRARFEEPYFKRIHRLSLFTLAEALEGKGRFLPEIRRYLEAVVSERTWTLPAHDSQFISYDKGCPWVQLFTTQRALVTAYAIAWFGDRLPHDLVSKACQLCRKRVIDPYLWMCRNPLRAQECGGWWFSGVGNWNPVCHAGCVMTTLALADNPQERALAIAGAERGTRAYLKGFPDDGYCSEGMGYWNYGFGSYVALVLAVDDATAGRLKINGDDPVVEKIVGYGRTFRLDEQGVAPPFADGDGSPDEAILSQCRRLVDSTGPAGPAGLSPLSGRTVNYGPFAQPCHIVALRAFVEGADNAVGPLAPLPPHTWYPDSQVLISRDRAHGLSCAVKGGHNGELHNHNDVGSYVVSVDGAIVAGDIGTERYTARTFSPRRYESKVINSYGHPVPRIGGALQATGAKYAARVLMTDFSERRDVVRLDLKGAYEVPSLTRCERMFVLDRENGFCTVGDELSFSSPTALEVPILTTGEAQREGEGWILMRDGKKVKVRADIVGGTWHWEDETLENPDRPTPRRLSVAFDRPVREARVTFTFERSE